MTELLGRGLAAWCIYEATEDGYQGACHECAWRGETVHPPNSEGKQAAREDAIRHVPSGAEAVIEAAARQYESDLRRLANS